MPEVVLSYVPRVHFIPFHQRINRWSCLVCHRRAGKTVACVNDLITRAVYTQKKNARYGYIAPFYRQAKDVAWMYLKEYTEGIANKVFESSLTVELFNGARITLYGADNPDALRGIYLDGVVIDEYGDCRPSLWAEVILPTLADRKGWAVFIGTPKGKNHFWEMHERALEEDGWFHFVLKASQSHILDAEELLEMKKQQSEDQYAQEFECSFEAAVVGTYYAKLVTLAENEGRIGNYPVDPERPVFVYADLGYSDSSAYWFWQPRPDGIGIVDYEEAAGEALSYYFAMLRSKGYEYDTVWLPHDARAKSLQTGRSTVEQFIDADFPVRIGAKLAVQHGIDAARFILPVCVFNKETTRGGVEALRSYRRQFDEVRKTFRDTPLHDWASNGADAFRGLSLVAKEQVDKEPDESEYTRMRKPVQYTLDQLWKDRDRTLSAGGGFPRIP